MSAYQRSVTATIYNRTKEKLIYKKIQVSDGTAAPPHKDKEAIYPGEFGSFFAHSDSFFRGTQGEVKYSLGNNLITLKWSNPYGPWNDTSYSIKAQDGKDVFAFCKVIDTHDATVDYYVYDVIPIEDSQTVNFINKDPDNKDIVFSQPDLYSYNNGAFIFHISNMSAILNENSENNIQLSINAEYRQGFFENYKTINPINKDDINQGVLIFPTKDIIDGYIYILKINEKEYKFTIDSGIHFPDDKNFKSSLTIGKNYSQKITILPNEQDVILKFVSIWKNVNVANSSKSIEGLPPGLSTSSTDPFTIVGIPTQSGQYDITATAIRQRDSARAVKHFSMSVIYEQMSINLKQQGVERFLNDYDNGKIYIYSNAMFACEVVISNGFPPYSIRVKNKDAKKPALPVGIELWDSFIIGTTHQTGDYVCETIVTDRYGNLATNKFTFHILDRLKILPEHIDTMDVTKLKEITLTSELDDKKTDLAYHLDDDSSAFFSIRDDNKLVIKNNVPPGVYLISVLASNRQKNLEKFIIGRKNYFIAIGKKLALQATPLPRGEKDVPYHGEIKINGAPPSHYPKGIAIIIPDLPGGLYLSPDFIIKGFPSIQGEFIINVIAADIISKNDYGAQSYKIIIDGPPVVKNVMNRTFPMGKISIPLNDYISSTVAITGGTCSAGAGSKVTGIIDNKGMLHLTIPDNTIGDVTLTYTIENKFGKSNVALIQFFIQQ